MDKENNVTTGVKFKLYFERPEDKLELGNYFDEYAKAVNFAANIVHQLTKNLKFAGKKIEGKWNFKEDTCSMCDSLKEIYYENIQTHKGICNDCYKNEFTENSIRKKLVPVKIGKRSGEKIDNKFNIHNATLNLSNTHYHYAVRDAFQLLESLKRQRKQKTKRFLRDKRRLKDFEEMINYPEKRIEKPLEGRQREKRYVHISQKDRLNELRGYTMTQIRNKIKILHRNLERDEKSLRKKQVIDFRGNRIMITPSTKFDAANNKVRLTIFPKEKSKPKWYGFSGIGDGEDGKSYRVTNPHGEKFFSQNLPRIVEAINEKKGKSKYAYVIRKQIGEEKDNPIYDYFLQYTIETKQPLKESYDGILGLDIGSSKIATAVFLPKNNGTKPSLVKFFRGEPLIALKIRRRKQLYFLRDKHNKRRKIKRIRPIEPKINQILHITSNQIVELAKEKNALIAIEKLEKPKKKRYRQYRKEKYLLSLFSFKKLSDLISYKAKREGIKMLAVNPEGTSSICSHCSSTNTTRSYKGTFSLFKCNNESCGIELNADYNAALNIAKKALNSLNK